MSIYSMHVSNVSRSKGSSSVAALSYITAMRVRDEYTGVMHYGYGRRERVLHVGVLLPEGAPAEYADPARLFNAIELHERQSNARTAKKIMVALPRELDAEQRIGVIERFVRENLTEKGYAAAYAIHEDKEGRNPHAHILVANRQIDAKTGRWTAKRVKEYVLDEDGNRVPVIDPKTGLQKVDKRNRKQWKRRDAFRNPLDSADAVKELRKSWADVCNELLPEGARISHLSNEARGLKTKPTIHEGYAAREIEVRGGTSMRCEHNRLIEAFNRQIRRIAAELADQVRQWTEQSRNAIERIKRATNRHPKTTGPTPLAEALDERTRLLGRIGDRVTILSDRARDAWADEDRAWDMLEPYNRRALEAGPLRRRKANKALRDMADRLYENGFEQGPVTPERFEAMRKQAADAAREDAYRDPIMRELTDRYEQADRQVRELGGASRRLPDRLHDLTDKPRPATAPAPRLADVARQSREDAGQPAHRPQPVRKPEQQPERQQERPVSLAAAAKEAKEAGKQLKREREPEPEPTLEWNPWDPADPMNLGMGGSQGYGLGL